ncbi:peptidyl-prolyl cis-trans isomerase C [Proteiniborus sp. DW1]|uniref:peptidylprolyl isomerase n=1 Tax=Proteiniborus sp. DW1 TaxID=1889883 RepID=UPI00092DF7C6|nr:peptidylprolyl isomerase [Proteiniborus sp. DW1]SCG82946.1 peptidyl-prolyl cis-trans isomerase C [Proteiniborus sp. DW1]
MEENKVLAIVNGKEITENDVEAFIQSLQPQVAAQFGGEEGKKKLLQELVNQELFYLDAIDNNLDKEEAFITELERIKVNLLKQYSVAKILNSVTATEDEIKDYYEKFKDTFKKPESVKASHILVDDEDTALNIIKEIKEGLSFAEAAKEYSKCPSSTNGGDLGYFTRGKMVPEFEKSAFELSKDEISNPVKTQFGYHIIHVTDKKEESESTIDEVRDELERQIIIVKQNAAYTNKATELLNKYEVKMQ